MGDLNFEQVLGVLQRLLGRQVTVTLSVDERPLATLGGDVRSAGEVRDEGHFIVWLEREPGHQSVVLYPPPIFERAVCEERTLVVIQAGGVHVTFSTLAPIGPS